MRMRLLLVFALVALVSVLGTAGAQGRPVTVALSGAAEVDNPATPVVETGDPDATGDARITLNPGRGEVCIDATVAKTDAVILAHIHRAPAGSNGPVVVDFTQLIDGQTITGCVSATRDVIRAILRNAAAYYLNVHTTVYPTGALRGQLR